MLDHAASRLAREAAAADTMTGGATLPDFAESAGTGDVELPQAAADSAESPAAAAPCRAAASAPTGTLDSARSAGTGDVESPRAAADSAESPAVAQPCCAAVSARAGGLVGDRTERTGSPPIACSVEGWTEWAGAATVGCTVEARTGWIGPAQAGDAAACCEVAGRSLLDYLLDEADAHHGTEPVTADADAEPSDSPVFAPSQHEAEPRGEQPAQRGASVLRDRAAVARKAFNRADALVELAQGYLRGDRPDRSPIEVTLTVPASVLRDEVTDPVEIGELGGSFVSRAAARRLSCDAGVVEILQDDQGAPLSVGRKQRTIAGALRRALHRSGLSWSCSTRPALDRALRRVEVIGTVARGRLRVELRSGEPARPFVLSSDLVSSSGRRRARGARMSS